MYSNLPIVLITEPIHANGLRILQKSCNCVTPWKHKSNYSSLVTKTLEIADAVIVRLFPMNKANIVRAKRLKIIAKNGTGLDNIACNDARVRGIQVIAATGINANAVAEHTIGLMIALARNTVSSNQALHSGQAYNREQFTGIELSGKTLGIIGCGNVGTIVAEKANSLGLEVISFDPYIDQKTKPSWITFFRKIKDVLTRADFVSLHVPLTNETTNFIDKDTLKLLQPTSYLINTSRGAVINELDLCSALNNRLLAGAALDVFQTEPLINNHELTKTPNTILTPHIAGVTVEAQREISETIAHAINDIFKGKTPTNLIVD